MENSPISWLEYSDKTLEQAIEEWIIDKNTRKLTAWLVMSNRDVGNIECITPEKMHSFVQGVLKLDENIAAAYHLPMQWPPESIESTQVLRDIMLLVPAWKNEVNADQSRSEELGIKQLLYPLQEHKQILASNSYPPGTEAFRMHLGMQPNDAWWRKLPLWSKEEKGVHATSNTWEHLMKKVLAHPHPEQGTRLALISSALEVLKKNDDHNSGGQPRFLLLPSSR